jgi:hypothetical protein
MSKAKQQKHSYKVGQTLWFVPFSLKVTGKPKEVLISNIGRRWGGLIGIGSNIKFSLDKGFVYSADTLIGELYLSKNDYQAKMKLQQVWDEFRGKVHDTRYPPEGINATVIEQVAQALNVPMA